MLVNALQRGGVVLSPQVATRDELFALVARRAEEAKLVRDASEFSAALVTSEAEGFTALTPSVAIPHARGNNNHSLFCFIVVMPAGVKFPPVDTPTRLAFIIGIPDGDQHYLDLLAVIMRLVNTAEKRQQIIEASSSEAVSTLIEAFCKPTIGKIPAGRDGLHGVVIIINKTDREVLDMITELAIELGIKGLTLLDGTNAVAKVALDIPFLSFLVGRNDHLASTLLLGVCERQEIAGVLCQLLLERGLDLCSPGAGTIMTFPLGQVYGAVDSDII